MNKKSSRSIFENFSFTNLGLNQNLSIVKAVINPIPKRKNIDLELCVPFIKVCEFTDGINTDKMTIHKSIVTKNILLMIDNFIRLLSLNINYQQEPLHEPDHNQPHPELVEHPLEWQADPEQKSTEVLQLQDPDSELVVTPTLIDFNTLSSASN